MRQLVGISLVLTIALAVRAAADETSPADAMLAGAPGEFGSVSIGAHQISDTLAIRMPFGFGTRTDGALALPQGYQTDVTVGGLGLVADYFIARGALRLSGGAVVPNYVISGEWAGEVVVNGSTYGGADLSLEIAPAGLVSPYIALGYDRDFASGWSLQGDVGAIISRRTGARLIDNNQVVPEAELAAEARAIADGIPDVIPHVRVGVSFSF